MKIVAAVLTGLVVLSGCVTETTGGIHEPAKPSVRVDAQLDLARGYLSKGDFARARAPLKRALSIDSRSVEAHVLTAVLNEGDNEPEVAEEHYRLALRYDPNNPQALNNYGSFLYRQGRYTEAVSVLRRLVKDTEYRARAQAFENLGLAELKVGATEKAKEAFTRALLHNADQVRSSLELADMAFAAGDIDVAKDYYEAFRQRATQNPRSLCLGIKLGRALGDVDQQASYSMALQNLYPDSPEAKRCEVPR